MRWSRGRIQLLTLFATVVFLALASWQLLPTIIQWNHRNLAGQIAQSIERGSRSATNEPLQRLANLGSPALRALVALSSSQRARVAFRARQTIEEKFATWQTRAGVDGSFDIAAPMMALASAFANQADRFDSEGKRWVSSLTIRMVDLAESLSADDATELLGECDRVLAAVPPQGPRLRSFPETAQLRLPANQNRLNVPDVQLDLLAVPSESSREIFSQGQVISLPEGETQTVGMPAYRESTPSKSTEFTRKSDLKFSKWSPKWNAQAMPQESSLRPLVRVAPLRIPGTHSSSGLSSEVVDVPTPQEMARNQKSLRKMSSKVLITRLRQADHYEAGSIRVVLRERGFAEAEWALAELFSSPRVEDRDQIVEAVSTLPADNTRRWLRWLLKDEAAEVRLHALTVLATTNDPQLFRLAREIAVADQDARVSELASRIMRQVR